MIDNTYCPFCSVIIYQATFAESKNFLAIYNIAPILPGHSLVIPRRHIEGLLDLCDQELSELAIFGRDTTKILQNAFGTTGFNWTVQDKEEAGQNIPHLHLHIIPRSSGDLAHPSDWYPILRDGGQSRSRLTPEQMREIVRHLRQTAKTCGRWSSAIDLDLQ